PGHEERFELWDIEKGRRLADVALPSGWSVHLSAEGKTGISDHSADRPSLFYDDGSVVKAPLSQDSAAVTAVSPDGNRFAVGYPGGTVAVFKRDTVLCKLSIGDFPYDLLFSPDGRRLLTLSSNGLRLWDADKGKELPCPALKQS